VSLTDSLTFSYPPGFITDQFSGKDYYKVVSGDTCQKIVDKYGTFSFESLWVSPRFTGLTLNLVAHLNNPQLLLESCGRNGLLGTPVRRLRVRWREQYSDLAPNKHSSLAYAIRSDPNL
jgi:hypothetical protein